MYYHARDAFRKHCVKFLVCALFYGDFPDLALRCAASIRALQATGRVDVRIGMNEVSSRSAALIDEALPGVDCIRADPQLYKYPMMRRLVHEYHGDATHLMWFDDDSCLIGGLAVSEWLETVSFQAERTQGALGSIYAGTPSAVERAWYARQPWHTGRPLPAKVLFPQGAWFVIALALLRRYDWPPAALRHNGGDVALGALAFQQGLALAPFKAGVAINADAALGESTAPRRGFSERPLGI